MLNLRAIALCLSAAAFCMAGVASAANGDSVYALPGRTVNAGHGVRLNFYCTGTGSPTVVFDAGWEDWSPSWVLVQPVIAHHTRACTYDRAGNGFSSVGPMPRTSVEIAHELHTALHNAGIAGPYLLVGHSFGSYNIRTFADLYVPEVQGMVIVDGESGDLSPPSVRARDARTFAKAVAELQTCRAAIAAHMALPSLPSTGHSYKPTARTPCSHQFFRGLPMPQWSAQLNAAVLRIANTRMILYDTDASEMREMPFDEEWLMANRRSLGNRPLVVLTARKHGRGPAFERLWTATQDKYLSLSSNARQILALRSGHYIQLDQPNLVINAILGELPRRMNHP